MEYCWISYIQKRICPSLADSLEPLAHRRNVASLSLFYRYYFGRCSSKLAQLVPLPYSLERSTCYFDRLEATYILKSSHNLCQNDTKLQTHPASILNVKMLNLAKIDVYNFKYKISVGNTMKLFFLLHKCIKKQVHKLEHK